MVGFCFGLGKVFLIPGLRVICSLQTVGVLIGHCSTWKSCSGQLAWRCTKEEGDTQYPNNTHTQLCSYSCKDSPTKTNNNSNPNPNPLIQSFFSRKAELDTTDQCTHSPSHILLPTLLVFHDTSAWVYLDVLFGCARMLHSCKHTTSETLSLTNNG